MPQVLLNASGPLPLSVPIAAEGNEPITFFFAGTCWTQTPDTNIGIVLLLDGQPIGKATVFSNGPSTHRAVVPQFAPYQFSDMGNHTLELVPMPGTITDLNDTFTIVLVD